MSNDTDRDAGARETTKGWTMARRKWLVEYLAHQAATLTRPVSTSEEYMYEAGKRYAFCENLLNPVLAYQLGEDPAGIVTRLQVRADRLWGVAHERGKLDRFDTGEVTVLGIYIPIIRDMVQEWAAEDERANQEIDLKDPVDPDGGPEDELAATADIEAVEHARTEALENGPTVGSPYA